MARAIGARALIWILMIALCVVFAIGRLPLYTGYWIPWYAPDSGGYFDAAYTMATGHLPLFSVRTPGYPLFLLAVLGVTNRVSAIIVVQQLATLVSGAALYFALVSARRWLAIPAAIAVAGFFAAGDLVMYESYMGPEALYTACLVSALAAMIFALHAESPKSFVVASTLMACAILLRPAGMFLVVVFAVALLALAWLRYPRRCIAAFGTPFVGLLAALATYNLVTLHQLTISPFGSVNLIGATATFWEDSAKYPPAMRDAIAEMRSLVTAQDRRLLEESSDPDALFQTYNRYYNTSLHVVLARHMRLDPSDASANALFKKVAFDAIAAHPAAYAKFVYTNLYNFLYEVPQAAYWFGYYIDDRYKQIYGKPPTAPVPASGPMRAYMLREFTHPGRLDNFTVHEGAAQSIEVASNRPLQLHRYVSTELFPMIYDTGWWLALTGTLWLAVVINLAVPGMPHRAPAATIAGTMAALMLIGAALVVALVELGLQRYAAPTRFLYFASLPLLIWIIAEWAVAALKRRASSPDRREEGYRGAGNMHRGNDRLRSSATTPRRRLAS